MNRPCPIRERIKSRIILTCALSLPYAFDHIIQRHTRLNFREQDKGEVYFKIRKTTPLRKLMEAYCDKQGVAMGSTRFMFDEKRLNPSQTAEQVGGLRTASRGQTWFLN